MLLRMRNDNRLLHRCRLRMARGAAVLITKPPQYDSGRAGQQAPDYMRIAIGSENKTTFMAVNTTINTAYGAKVAQTWPLE